VPEKSERGDEGGESKREREVGWGYEVEEDNRRRIETERE
jgi:hypothetical protein